MARRHVAAALLVLLGCGRTNFPDANIVVIGIDTLRADHVGVYGYPRPTTPRIDAFSKDSVRFATAVSQSSWTLPAFASMFTGLLPSYHRAGEGRFPSVSYLDPTYTTLASVLHAAGFRTASFVSNVWVGAEVGMARDFDQHRESILSEQAAVDSIAWLRDHRAERFFLFVHIMAPHQPYWPPPEDAAPFIDPSYAGPIGTMFVGDAKSEWTDADRRRVVDLYDGDVHFADRLTGHVLDAVSELGLDRNTIVVVIADHGEELFDHGRLSHGNTLYDELLLVPMIVRFPGGRWRGHVDRVVRTMDLFPTLIEAAGLPVPTDINAVSLMPLVRGVEGIPGSDVALSEYVCYGEDDSLKSLRTPTEKLILSPATGQAALFDLVGDPHERHDLSAERPERTGVLRAKLEKELVPSQNGFHLLARSGPIATNILRARFRAETAIRDVSLSMPEAEDRYRLSPDARVLDVKLHLRPLSRPVPATDVDGIGFRTVDDAPVLLQRLSIDGSPPPWGQVSLGSGTLPPNVPLPWRLGPATPNLTVRYPQPPPVGLDLQPRVRLDFVRRGEPPTTAVRPETLERLKALGYL